VSTKNAIIERDINHLNIGKSPVMSMGNFLRKLGGVIEIFGYIANAHEPSKKEKEAYNREIDMEYDDTYYSGELSPISREFMKESLKRN